MRRPLAGQHKKPNLEAVDGMEGMQPGHQLGVMSKIEA
jgi:hypothetical protein